MADLLALGRLIGHILAIWRTGILLFFVWYGIILRELAKLAISGIGKLFSAIGSAMLTAAKISFAYGFPIAVGVGIIALLAMGSPAMVVVTGAALGLVTALKFLIPSFIRLAVFKAAPLVVTVLPGALAAAAAHILPDRYLNPEPDNVSNAAAVAGATTALALGVRAAAFTPYLAATLSAPVSVPWLIATSAVATAGMNAGLIAREYFRPAGP